VSPVVPTAYRSVPKREYDLGSTGFTPQHKRYIRPDSQYMEPPATPMFTSPYIGSDGPSSNGGSKSTEDFHQLRYQVKLLEERILEKDEIIVLLREQIKLLHSLQIRRSPAPESPPNPSINDFSVDRQSYPSLKPDSPPKPSALNEFFARSPSPVPSIAPSASPTQIILSPSPTPSIPCLDIGSDPIIEDTPPAPVSQLPGSYIEAVMSNVTKPVAPLPPPVIKVTVKRDAIQAEHRLSFIYFKGLDGKTIGEFRKVLTEKGFPKMWVKNISFIGKTIVEIVVERETLQSFVDKAKASGFTVDTTFDPTEKSKSNPVWVTYGNPNTSIGETVRDQFVKRVSHEIKTCGDHRVKKVYMAWAESMGWAERLLLPSTPSSSK
jgi:hypothetical protein